MGRYIEAEAFLASETGFGKRTYRAYVPHPLAGWEPLLGINDLKAVSAADLALNTSASLPQTALGTMIADWMMARDESIRSSAIEGIESTGSGLAWAQYQNELDKPVSDQNDALTLGAAKQTVQAIELGAKIRDGGILITDDVLKLHRILFDGTPNRAIGGVLRDSPIWIGPPDCLIDNASFVAPPEGHVVPLLEDLVDYLNQSDHPPVLKAAIVHCQFETIHPFEDGNGRTGRALIHLVLNAAGVVCGTLPISTILSDDRTRYYHALNSTRAICDREDNASRSAAVSQWLLLFSRSCQGAKEQITLAARNAESLRERWQTQGRFRSDSAAAALLHVLPTMPVLDSTLVSKRLSITKRAARNAIKSLESAGIVSRTGGQRNRRYIVHDMVDDLRRFAPDGGVIVSRLESLSYSQRLPSPAVSCGVVGPRSQRPCLLPKGHQGQHRYRV